ncbi:hypothetical protein MTYP_01042 [Methylophilaceae bacterium]|jgi:hypothetical protein|nr:hypothetical protein MTYP_01042 [Methylophilaceae bacterium]
MRIKPASGRQVPDPDKGGYLPPEGRNVEPNLYWLRRIADGDVVKVSTKTAKIKGADK